MGQKYGRIRAESAYWKAAVGLRDRAEIAGLVRRVAVPTDRPAINVELAPAGRKVGNRIHTEVLNTIGRSLSKISAEHQEILISALSTVTAHLGK